MGEKSTKLSIILAAVDQTAAPFRALKARIDSISKPVKSAVDGFKSAFPGIGSVVGTLGGVIGKVGSAIGDMLEKIPAIGLVITGAVGGAIAGLVHLIDTFDELGKKAARLGVGVDELAGLRYAAEQTGVPVEELDDGLKKFTENLGRAKAGTGRMAAFLERVSPALLHQLVAAKSNAEAFGLLANAMSKLKDPAKLAALSLATVGDSDLSTFLAQGSKGIKQYTDEQHGLTGSLAPAAAAAAKAKEAMNRLHQSVIGAEAGIEVGLAPALTTVVDQLTRWFGDHQADITVWSKKIGDELPGAVDKVSGALQDAIVWLKDALVQVKKLVDELGGLQHILDLLSQGTKVLTFGEKFSPVGIVRRLAGSDDDETGPEKGTTVGDALAQMRDARKRAGLSENVNSPVDDAMAQVQAAQPRSIFDRPYISPTLGGMIGMTPGQQQAAPPPQNATVNVIVSGPRGTRVTTDPRSTADVSTTLNIGRQLEF